MYKLNVCAICLLATYTIFLSACKSRKNDYSTSALGCDSSTAKCDGANIDILGTKTPYWIQQDPQTYEKPPSGYEAVFVNVLSRHSSRGLAKPSSDLVLFNLVEKAKSEEAATPLALSLGSDMLELIGINAFLGENIKGMSPPGYGNLSRQGVEEHKGLGERLYQRMESLFGSLTNTGTKNPQRSIVITYSGAPRTIDSAHFFEQGLTQKNPELASLIKLSEPASDSSKPGENSYTMHFHDLNPTDNPAPASALTTVLSDSLAYQDYKKSQEYLEKIASLRQASTYQKTAETVLSALFSQDFIDKIANGTHQIDNSGQVTVKNQAGRSITVGLPPGKKPSVVKDLVEVVEKIFDVYAIAAPLHYELNGKDYARYLPLEQAKQLSLLQDAEDFYDIGPGMEGAAPATYRMAQGLLDEMFAQVDAIANGNFAHAANLRFSHAEVLVPLVSILGIEGYSEPLPDKINYSYDNSSWRGRVVAPLMGNIQWDVYRNQNKQLALRMLLNEKEVDFRSDCASAKISGSKTFYDYSKLKTCYEQARTQLANRSMPKFTVKRSSNQDASSKGTVAAANIVPSISETDQILKTRDQDNMLSSQSPSSLSPDKKPIPSDPEISPSAVSVKISPPPIQTDICKQINQDGDTCAAIEAREGEQVCHWGQRWVCENGCARWLASSCNNL